MTNSIVMLTNRVWKQVRGIPMDFAYSPLWCNIYFMTYEVHFIIPLARLQCPNLLAKFAHVYYYIDDIHWLKMENLLDFLFPTQPCMPNKCRGSNSWMEPRSELMRHFKIQDETREEWRGFLTLG